MLALTLVLVGCISALGINALINANASLHASQTMLREVSELGKANDQIMRARLRLQRAVEYTEAGETSRLQTESRDIDAALAQARSHLALFRQHAQTHSDNARYTQAVLSSFEAMLQQGMEPLRAHLAAGTTLQFRAHNLETVVALSRALGQAITEYEADADLRSTANVAAAEHDSNLTITAMIIALGFLVLVLILADRYVVHYLKHPLDHIKQHFQRIATGDLTHTLPLFGRSCVGQLIPFLRHMQASLARTVLGVRQGVDEINTGAREIAAGNADLSSRTEQQAASLEETAASMEELAATVKQNADNARQANQMASSASSVAQRGGEAVQQVVGTMRDIAASSQRIGEIVGVIDGIAFQTNILALNAAVEAARAGEQGKGFAVVASEVRSLAQRSANAAKEIKGLIATSVSTVQAGSSQVEQAGSTMDELVSSVRRVSDIISEIAAASSEQSGGIHQVNQAVAQMDEVTQQNAALVEQAAAAAGSLEAQAYRLQETVAVFQITQESWVEMETDMMLVTDNAPPSASALGLPGRQAQVPKLT